MNKDSVKYFKGGDEYIANRCPFCDHKRYGKLSENIGCPNGCKATDADAEVEAIHLGELKGAK